MMMRMPTAALLTVLSVGGGCKKAVILDTNHWTQPQIVSHSAESLNSGIALHKWNNTLLALNNDSGPLEIYFLEEDGTTWKKKADAPADLYSSDFEPTGNRFVHCKGLRNRDYLAVTFTIGMIDVLGMPRETSRVAWKLDKLTLFRKAGTNVFISSSIESGPVPQPFFGAIFDGSVICVPYCIDGETVRDRVLVTAEGPFDNGVFVSHDSGKSWKKQSIDSTFSSKPHVCGTERFFYYIAGKPDNHELWFSQRHKDNDKWSPPQVLTKHYATQCVTATGAGTIHVCWLDRRHERKRLNPVYPGRENYEVVYCHRQDSDTTWTKDVILSEGLFYAYSPSMSVEGDNIVVAWAGANDKDGHDENWPNDIYYVVSKDAGKTWNKPLKVTDGFKDGITSGQPQVALHKGVIHLFYIQGKINYKEVSAGMALLNQPPWPIYYTQRPFPE